MSELTVGRLNCILTSKLHVQLRGIAKRGNNLEVRMNNVTLTEQTAKRLRGMRFFVPSCDIARGTILVDSRDLTPLQRIAETIKMFHTEATVTDCENGVYTVACHDVTLTFQLRVYFEIMIPQWGVYPSNGNIEIVTD